MKVFLTALALVAFLHVSSWAAPLLPTDWSEWRRTTTALLNYRIPGHEDHFRIPYINKTGETVRPVKKDGRLSWDYPKGTIILKEAYAGLAAPANGEKPIKLYGMIKDPSNSKARGGWVWVVRDMKTNKETIMDSPLCIDCHSYANGKHPYGDKNPDAEFRDYVYFPYSPKSP